MIEFENSNIFVMNGQTWEAFKEKEFEFANTQPDPIKYIMDLGKMNVATDETVPFGVIEMWTRENWEKFCEETGREE